MWVGWERKLLENFLKLHRKKYRKYLSDPPIPPFPWKYFLDPRLGMLKKPSYILPSISFLLCKMTALFDVCMNESSYLCIRIFIKLCFYIEK